MITNDIIDRDGFQSVASQLISVKIREDTELTQIMNIPMSDIHNSISDFEVYFILKSDQIKVCVPEITDRLYIKKYKIKTKIKPTL